MGANNFVQKEWYWFRNHNTLGACEIVNPVEDKTEHDLPDGGDLAGALHLLQMKTVPLVT